VEGTVASDKDDAIFSPAPPWCEVGTTLARSCLEEIPSRARCLVSGPELGAQHCEPTWRPEKHKRPILRLSPRSEIHCRGRAASAKDDFGAELEAALALALLLLRLLWLLTSFRRRSLPLIRG
jgi:hypothetical protein